MRTREGTSGGLRIGCTFRRTQGTLTMLGERLPRVAANPWACVFHRAMARRAR